MFGTNPTHSELTQPTWGSLPAWEFVKHPVMDGRGGWGRLVFPWHRCPVGPAEMHVIPHWAGPLPAPHLLGHPSRYLHSHGVSALIVCSAAILPSPVPVIPILKAEEKQFSLYSFKFLAEAPVNKRQIQKRKKKKKKTEVYTCTWETPSKTE